MIGLVALTAVAVVTALALRRVRDRLLTALGVAGLFLLAVPALFVNGDALERIIAAVYMYAPYWEYLIPVAFFALALLPGGGRKSRKRRKTMKKEVVIV
ncbi:MAG: hypothetical protein ABWK05_00015 [Pyrobaculum sp.]